MSQSTYCDNTSRDKVHILQEIKEASAHENKTVPLFPCLLVIRDLLALRFRVGRCHCRWVGIQLYRIRDLLVTLGLAADVVTAHGCLAGQARLPAATEHLSGDGDGSLMVVSAEQQVDQRVDCSIAVCYKPANQLDVIWEARNELKVPQHHIEVDGKPTHCKHQGNCHQHLEHLLFCFGLADLIGICHFAGNLSGPDLGDDCPVQDRDHDQRDGVKQDVAYDSENPGGVDAEQGGPLLGAVAFFGDSHGVDQGGAGHQRRQPSEQD